MEQRTIDWFQSRLGKVTASNVWKLLSKTKTGWGAERDNYKADLVVERLTGAKAELRASAAMLWGVEQEQFARAAYELSRDCLVEEVGFIDHPTVLMSGASPDGFVGDDGLIEIKCPETKSIIDVWLGASIPDKYLKQIYWQMACTKRVWCDYVVFDPRMPVNLQLFVKRVDWNNEVILKMESDVKDFLNEVDSTVSKLKDAKL